MKSLVTRVVVLLFSMILLSLSLWVPAHSGPASISYKVVPVVVAGNLELELSPRLQELLDREGKEGWRLVALVPVSGRSIHSLLLFTK